MQVEQWPKCAMCGNDFRYSNEYVFPDGLILCRDCFDNHREQWDKNGTKYFFQHVPGAAWPNTAHAFTFETENELLERLINAFGNDCVYTHLKSEEWSRFNGSYIMTTNKKGEDWCIGYVNCDLSEIPVLAKKE